MSLRDLQEFIKAKDHHPELSHDYFLKLIEVVGELAEVIRKNKRLVASETIKGTIEEELYDVLYYTVALANIYEVDLTRCFHLKEEINRQKYGRSASAE
ncbi:MAG: MazG nucleotide pyrophosphohydrolase domain-containing protein [Bacillota bacterium]